MQGLLDFFADRISYFSTMRLADIIDVIIVAYLIYKIIEVIRKTSSYNLARGLFLILVTLWLSGILKLTMINYLLRKAVEIGLIALVILFQPELRKLLTRMGSSSLFAIFGQKAEKDSGMEAVITQTVLACEEMSATKTGALIIFERQNVLDEVIKTGTVIDAATSSELLKNVFYPKAPLHDGALIIRDGRIAAAGCVLPLTNKTNLSKDLGMRHRAGIGMSEQGDALVVIVSEETGAISVAEEGMLKRNLNRATFEKLLRRELAVEEEEKKSIGDIVGDIRTKLKGKQDEREKAKK